MTIAPLAGETEQQRAEISCFLNERRKLQLKRQPFPWFASLIIVLMGTAFFADIAHLISYIL